MALLIRHYPPNSGTAREREVDGVVSIGRATDNTVQLPGALIALHHARVFEQAGAVLHFECLSPLGMDIGGRAGATRGDLSVGEEGSIGGHRLRCVLRDDGHSAVLEIREAEKPDDSEASRFMTDLTRSGMRMRPWALGLSALILLLGLVVPLLMHGSHLPAWARGIVANDSWLSPGPMSNGHRQFGADCGKCHVGVLRRVADEQCLSCHQNIAGHSDNPAIANAHGYGALRCGSCHQDHQGPHGMFPQQTALCTSCHAHPSRFPDFPELATVTDFGTGHPAFRATVGTLHKNKIEPERQRLSASIADDDGLYFPHDVHLKTAGIRSDRGHETLQCASCHRPDIAKLGFEPIRYERDCQRCHQLDIEYRGQSFRLPHGDDKAVRALLDAAPTNSAAHAVLTPAPEIPRQRPGATAERGDPASVTDSVDEIFSRRVCGLCHETSAPEAGPVQIIKPMLRQSWLSAARFDHAPHQWVPCKTCHAAEQSSNATDLLLPDLSTCRDCHAGIVSSRAVASACSGCHSFHRASRTPMRISPTGEPGNDRPRTDAPAP